MMGAGPLRKWKWSSDLKGPLKVPQSDALAGFRVKDFLLEPRKPVPLTARKGNVTANIGRRHHWNVVKLIISYKQRFKASGI